MFDENAYLVLFFCSFAAGLGFFRAHNVAKTIRETENWKTTRGRVLEARIVGWGKGKQAAILYEYYAPARLVGSKICAPGCEESDPKVYIRWYRIGREINVHYNPADPQQCMLELPAKRTVFAWKMLGTIGLIFPVIYIVWISYLES